MSLRPERRSWLITLLHYAAERRSPEFCKVIHDQNDTLVKTKDDDGWLPLHCACFYGNVNAAKYLYSVYPESSNIADNEGWYPLHLLAMCRRGSNENRQELLLFLLKHNNGAVSTPNHDGCLPLHIACRGMKQLSFTKSYLMRIQMASLFKTKMGILPLNFTAKPRRIKNVTTMVNSQSIEYCKCKRRTYCWAQSSLWWEPIVPVLMLLTSMDAYLFIWPVNMCGGNLPLHHACLAGKPDIVSYILKTTDHGVTVQNSNGKLPIQMLLFDATCDRDLQYVDAVDSLFRANPVDSLAIIFPGLFANDQ
eukprot:scaffold54458_cov36-Cyclotella_meneghiniana.AAC.1